MNRLDYSYIISWDFTSACGFTANQFGFAVTIAQRAQLFRHAHSIRDDDASISNDSHLNLNMSWEHCTVTTQIHNSSFQVINMINKSTVSRGFALKASIFSRASRANPHTQTVCTPQSTSTNWPTLHFTAQKWDTVMFASMPLLCRQSVD